MQALGYPEDGTKTSLKLSFASSLLPAESLRPQLVFKSLAALIPLTVCF